MYRSAILSALGLVGFLVAFVPFQLTDDLEEIKLPPTNCVLPIILPSFDSTSIQTRPGSKGQVVIEIPVVLQHPGITALGSLIGYNVTLKSMDDWHSTAVQVDAGRATTKDNATVVARFSVPEKQATSQNSFQVEVSADAESHTGSSSGLDRVYISFLDQTKGNPVATARTATDYWHSKTQELKQANFTLPTFEKDESLRCACHEAIRLPKDMPQLPPGQPLPPTLPAQPLVLNVEVDYEGINGIWYRLAGAKVALYSQANPTGPPSQILKLGAWGSVTARLSFYPVAAKVIFSDDLFTIQQGPDRAHLSTWEFDLSIFPGNAHPLEARGRIPASIGPDLGHVWSEWHRIRRNGETIVGLDGVPAIVVWFPAAGDTSYYTTNFIALLGARSRLPEVSAHEYGHHVMHSVMEGGIPSGGGGAHSFCGTTANAVLAFVEGYATAFGLQVLGLRSYRGEDLEALSCPANRDMLTSEGRVVAGMLDLMDNDPSNPECSGGNADLGRPDYCDRTGGTLFTPNIVLRDSIAGPQLASITAWWERLSTTLSGQVGILDGWEAMRYNYYPILPCRRRWGNVCFDQFPPLLPPFQPRPTLPPRMTPRPSPRPRPRPSREDL